MRTQSILRGIIAAFASAAVVLAAVPAAAGPDSGDASVAPRAIVAAKGCIKPSAIDVTDDTELRAAILASTDDSHICMLNDITVLSPLPSIDDTDLTIDGDGDGVNLGDGQWFTLDLNGFGPLSATYTNGDVDYLELYRLRLTGANASAALQVTGAADDVVSLEQVEILSNTAGAGVGVVTVTGAGSLSVSESLFRSNSTVDRATLTVSTANGTTIVNTTFSQNTTTGAAGGAIQVTGGDLTLRYATVVGNSATAGSGGGLNQSAGASTIVNSVFFNNSAATGADVDLTGTSTQTISTSSFMSAADVVGATVAAGSSGVLLGDPGLCPLADNGGPTHTAAPKPGSPLLDAGAGINTITVDQRLVARPGTGATDIGAVEGTGSCGAFQAPADPAPAPVASPPSAPLNVTARLKVGRIARIVWDPPASIGSFPVTNYLVQASTGGGSCLSAEPVRTCDIPGVVPGVTYTYRVQALNGAGWGPFSAPSNAVTWGELSAPISEPNEPGGIDDVDKPIDPLNPNDPANPGGPSDPGNPGDPSDPNDPANPGDPDNPGQPGLGPTPTIMIIGAREDPKRVTATGYTSDIPVGVRVVPWRKVTGMRDFERGTGIRRLLPDESFEWQRRIRATRTITFYFTALDGVSNQLTITPNGRVSP